MARRIWNSVGEKKKLIDGDIRINEFELVLTLFLPLTDLFPIRKLK